MSGDEALVVLRYEWWRVAWTLFFPATPLLLISYSALSDLLSVAPNGMPLIITIGAIILGLGYSFILIDMLLTKKVSLYQDRIIKTYYALFSTRTIFLSTAKYDAANMLFCLMLKIYDRRQSRMTGGIRGIFLSDMTLYKKKDAELFFRVLSELSGRSIDELTSNTWKPKMLKKE